MTGLRANLRLSDACERYLERLKNSGQAERSQYTAYYVLLRLQKAFHAGRDKDPLVHTITPDTMDSYCYGEKGIRRDIGSSAFNRYRSVLNSFFEYAMQMRWTDTNPMDAIDRARPDAARKPPAHAQCRRTVGLTGQLPQPSRKGCLFNWYEYGIACQRH